MLDEEELLDEDELLDEEELLDELDDELDELDELLEEELISAFSPPQPVRINPSAKNSAVLFINPH